MAGAVAVVVFDNVDGPLIPMAKKAEDNDVNVPSVFVSKESGEALETLLNDPKHGKTVVVTLESPDSPFDDWPNVATSACVTFGALCVLLSVVLVLKRREQAQLAAAAAARPPETRLLSAEEVACAQHDPQYVGMCWLRVMDASVTPFTSLTSQYAGRVETSTLEASAESASPTCFI